MDEGIAGKVVAITGASSGIGAATAELLAARGARVVLGARRTERLAELAGRLPEAAWARTDVRSRDDLAALVGLAQDRFGRLDVLVGNAGTGKLSALDELRVDEWDELVDVNVRGVLNGIAAALPVFRAQGSGHFVHLASTAAFLAVPTMAVYAGTKTAVRFISEGLRREAGADLRVTLVTPGYVATDFASDATSPGIQAQLAAGRGFAIPPAAIARAVAFAIEQPAEVDVGEIVIRPTAQA